MLSDVAKLRREHLLHHAPLSGKALEIGPYDQPTILKSEMDIRYLDMKSRDQLVVETHNKELISNIPDTDYVVYDDNYAAVVKETFDIVIANHVGEHVPNFIGWLEGLTSMLNPSGVLFMALPDKNFTFDRYRQDTSLSRLLCDYHTGQSEIARDRQLDCELMYDTEFVGQPFDFESRFSKARIEQMLSVKPHIGIHSQVFQSSTFIDKVLRPIIHLDYLDLEILNFIPAQAATGGELITILRRGKKASNFDQKAFFADA